MLLIIGVVEGASIITIVIDGAAVSVLLTSVINYKATGALLMLLAVSSCGAAVVYVFRGSSEMCLLLC